MTEAEWLQAAEPTAMLNHLGDRASNRKVRLFICAVGRRAESAVAEAWFRDAIDVAERYADGLVTDEMLTAQYSRVTSGPHRRSRVEGHARDVVYWLTHPGESILSAAQVAVQGFSYRKPSVQRGRAALLRDIFGNPFRQTLFDPQWRTADVMGLARAIYEDRAFDRLPLLADALMDAGCSDEDILNHCRSGGPHVRGCWAVDLVLGRE